MVLISDERKSSKVMVIYQNFPYQMFLLAIANAFHQYFICQTFLKVAVKQLQGSRNMEPYII